MMNPLPVSIPPEILETLFPCHVALERNMEVCQAGQVITRLCPKLKSGLDFRDLFIIERPPIPAKKQGQRHSVPWPDGLSCPTGSDSVHWCAMGDELEGLKKTGAQPQGLSPAFTHF
ncbi:MAG: hypothetical protein JRF52_13980 [Deltaproteobacteria bacterium]|nr:hypothetical protein [Deltaproteobacteria bacterium]